MNGARSRLWSFFSPAIAGFLCAIAAVWFPAAAQAEFGSVSPAPAPARGGVGSSVTLVGGALAGERPGADRQCVDCPRSFLFAIGAEPVASSGALAARPGEPLLNEGGPEISGLCPQTRKTPQAPDSYYKMKNPLAPSENNILAGKTLFHFDTRPTPCRICHGLTGNGLGLMFKQTKPQPRNFTCYVTMKNIPDGQMFWIIQNGSPGTDMPAYKNLEDDQIWQLILYIRHIEE